MANKHSKRINDSESISDSALSASESYSEEEQKNVVNIEKKNKRTSKKLSPEPKDVEPKKRAPYRKKYKTAEEAHSARLEQMRKWRQNRKERSVTITLPDADTRAELLKVLGFVRDKVEITPGLEQTLADLMQQTNSQSEQKEQ